MVDRLLGKWQHSGLQRLPDRLENLNQIKRLIWCLTRASVSGTDKNKGDCHNYARNWFLTIRECTAYGINIINTNRARRMVRETPVATTPTVEFKLQTLGARLRSHHCCEVQVCWNHSVALPKRSYTSTIHVQRCLHAISDGLEYTCVSWGIGYVQAQQKACGEDGGGLSRWCGATDHDSHQSHLRVDRDTSN